MKKLWYICEAAGSRPKNSDRRWNLKLGNRGTDYWKNQAFMFPLRATFLFSLQYVLSNFNYISETFWTVQALNLPDIREFQTTVIFSLDLFSNGILYGKGYQLPAMRLLSFSPQVLESAHLCSLYTVNFLVSAGFHAHQGISSLPSLKPETNYFNNHNLWDKYGNLNTQFSRGAFAEVRKTSPIEHTIRVQLSVYTDRKLSKAILPLFLSSSYVTISFKASRESTPFISGWGYSILASLQSCSFYYPLHF